MNSLKHKMLLVSFTLLCTSLAYGQDTLDFNKVVKEINQSLEQAQQELIDVELTSASVTLSVIEASAKGGGFKIFGKGSAKWSKENSSSITFNYESIEASSEKSFVKAGLTDIIINATKAYKETKEITGLSKKDFNIELSFSIKKADSGGVEFELFGIGFDASGERSKNAVHKIKLTFSD